MDIFFVGLKMEDENLQMAENYFTSLFLKKR